MIDPAEGQPEAVGDEAAEQPSTDPFMDIAGEMLGEEETPAEDEDAEKADEVEEAEDETDDEAEADDLPPIDAPVSWDAEAKAKFSELPRDVQEYVAKREGERERFVQQKSQEATHAQRTAQQAAIQQLAEVERGYAQEYRELASRFEVPEPDMSLIATDPTTYAMQARQYQLAQAQKQQLQQAAEHYHRQAQARDHEVQQAEYAEQARIITERFPEYADPTTGPEIQRNLSAVAKELGYSDDLIAQARADDILAMRKAAEWKAKADQLDRLNAKKMEKVRAAKGLPKTVKPGVAVSNEQTRAARTADAWERTKTSRGQARDDAFADYLKTQGIL